MTDQLKNVLNYITKFNDEEFEIISNCFKPEFIKQNQLILRQGETCNKFYFVVDGCIRVFFTNSKGVEKTRYIMSKNHVGTALTSFITQKPSFEQIDALNDTHLLSIGHQSFYDLNNRVKSWNLFYQKILEMAYAFQTKKIESLVTKNAGERFEQVMQENPSLFQTVSNKVLSSYLDMTPETLSRLKSR